MEVITIISACDQRLTPFSINNNRNDDQLWYTFFLFII